VQGMSEAPGDSPPKGDLQPPEKSKASTGVIVIALVAGLALGAGGYLVMTRRAHANGKKETKPEATSKPQDAAPVALLSLDPFVVNLADPDHSSYLRVQVTLGLDKALPATNGEEKDSPFTPVVRDTILSIITTCQSGQLLSDDGKKKLKEQLLTAIQRRAPQLGVVHVYFTDFLIQQ
jgi:flagellar protein FliL